MTSPSYILMTAAHNEARFLPDTIASVLAQTVQPLAWIIVSDNSTDETGQIAAAAAEAHGFIRFLRFQNPLPRSPHPMGGTSWKKVSALRAGLAALGDVASDYLGNLDADVTFAPGFYATLMERMQARPDLGIAGSSSTMRAMAGNGRISSTPRWSAGRSSSSGAPPGSRSAATCPGARRMRSRR